MIYVKNIGGCYMKRDECELARAAYKFIDIYLDMGCFKNPELVRPALLEGFTFGYREAEKYIEDFYKPKDFPELNKYIESYQNGQPRTQ